MLANAASSLHLLQFPGTVSQVSSTKIVFSEEAGLEKLARICYRVQCADSRQSSETSHQRVFKDGMVCVRCFEFNGSHERCFCQGLHRRLMYESYKPL